MPLKLLSVHYSSFPYSLQTKTSRPQMGREEDSRGTTQVDRIRHLRLAVRFVLTNISLSCNVEITVQTTRKNHSPERLKRELQLPSVECNFQRLCCTSLTASISLLSSIGASI